MLLFGCLALAFAATLPGRQSVLMAQGTKVESRVWAETADGATGHFLVILNHQADAKRAVAQAQGRIEQGRGAVAALRQAADVSQPTLRAELDAMGVRYRSYWIVNVIAVEGKRAVVEALAARSDVKAIESDAAFRVPFEPTPDVAPLEATGVEWNVSKVNAPALWAMGFTGQGRVYANADTGVKWDHPALKGQYRGWNGTTASHSYNWWDAIHSDISGNGVNPCGFSSTAPCDDHGHGTHTMGTGIGDDGAGNQVGVAPSAKWIACRNMDEGFGRPSTYIECLQFFMAPWDAGHNNPDPDKRPDAMGNSYDCPAGELCSPNSLLAAVDNLRAAGVFVAASGGNSGPGCSTVSTPPAIYDSAITVGATDSSDNIAPFSSRGPVTVDGSYRRKPDLVAPGVLVRSSEIMGGYSLKSGTSMASPHVAGAVTLLWSAIPQLRRNVWYTEVILEHSALGLTSSQGCGGDPASQVPNNVYGYGRLDVLAAYNYALTRPQPFSAVLPAVSRW